MIIRNANLAAKGVSGLNIETSLHRRQRDLMPAI